MKKPMAMGMYPEEIRLYKRRWLLMAIFLLHILNIALHSIQFSSISNIITRYYKISATWVEWTTLVFMAAFLVGVLPALCILEKLGIKCTLIITSFAVMIGTIIKLLSVKPDRFYILMIGQTIVAVASTLVAGLAGRFMATWFGNEEISRTGALIFVGEQFGCSLGFLLPSLLVQDSPDEEVIEQQLTLMHRVFVTITIVTFILIVLFFEEKPKIPPSFAQVKQLEKKEDVWKSVVHIFKQKSFVLMSLSYSLAFSSHNITAVLLNQLIEKNFKEKTQDAGKIGFVLMISGIMSSFVCGHLLDRTRNFKGNAVILSLGGAVSMIIFTVVLKLEYIVLVYVAVGMVGFFLLGYEATGVQMGIELTHPVSEGIVMSSMCLFTTIISIFLTFLHGFVIKEYSDVVSNIGVCSYLIMSFIFACLIPSDLKREKTEKSGTTTELQEFISKR